MTKINLLTNLISEKISKSINEYEILEKCKSIDDPEKFFEYWTNAVTVKWHAPSGLFSTGSASEIAQTLKQVSDSFKQAVNRLTFYKSRAGENLSAERKSILDKAHDILKKLYSKE